jgi:hypothetical protein
VVLPALESDNLFSNSVGEAAGFRSWPRLCDNPIFLAKHLISSHQMLLKLICAEILNAE